MENGNKSIKFAKNCVYLWRWHYIYFIFVLFVQLSSKAQINNYVKPIALADHNSPVPQHCIVSGWGKTSMNAKLTSNKLMEVEVTLIGDQNCPNENSFCSEGKTGPGPVSNLLFWHKQNNFWGEWPDVWSAVASTFAFTFQGDSGGPLVCEGEVAYGVVSSIYTPPSGGKQLYVFAKISDQKRWITSTMKKSLIKY